MPYPTHSRVQIQNNAPSLANGTPPAILTHYNNLVQQWDESHAAYLQTNHERSLTAAFSRQNEIWTIDRIVVVGIGYPPNLTQLSLIIRVAEVLEGRASKKIEMYSQEDRSEGLDEDKPIALLRASELFKRLGIQHRAARNGESHQPAASLTTETTLLYTPMLISGVVLELMRTLEVDPELWITVAAHLITTSFDHSKELVQEITTSFLGAYVWKHVPIYDKQCCDRKGNLSNLSIHRRIKDARGVIDNTWSQTTGGLTAPQPNGWAIRCANYPNC